ncbi:MAG: macro domain-containing protein [Rhodospirillales bacterium]|nr:macro domain-containing protein [Rhodospirillales bacterium]
MSQDIADTGANAKILVEIYTGDITHLPIEAVATIITPNLDIHGRLNRALFSAAGPEMDAFILDHVLEPQVGDVFAVPGFHLPAQQVLFAVVPIWRSDLDIIDKHLIEAVRGLVTTARQKGIKDLAIPLLASGRKGYPQERGVRLILQGVSESAGPPLRRICFVCETGDVAVLYRQRLVPLA